MDIVRRLESLGSQSGATSEPVQITSCGVLADDTAVDAVVAENKQLSLDKVSEVKGGDN